MQAQAAGHYPSQPSHGPRSKCDHVVHECLCKAVEVIVSSRSRTSTNRPYPNSRFNLQLPENPTTRDILLRWKGSSLYVPMRVDVYYQHPGENGDRELLERWCLAYQHSPAGRFLEREFPSQPQGTLVQDPIVHLRHVCKRIVIWLRTLYAWSRTLPAAALQGDTYVGFSIYAQPEDNDTTNLGFQALSHPTTVTTPYGELKLTCWSTTNEHIQKLAPVRRTNARVIHPSSLTQPIPIQQQLQSQEMQELQAFPKSLDSARRRAPQEQSMTVTASKSYHQPTALHRRNTTASIGLDGGGGISAGTSELPRTAVLNRRNTTDNITLPEDPAPQQPDVPPPSDKGPERVLSGLSLALMMQEESDERRRAALHQAPPHREALPPPTGEYGYAYNNHISWKKIQPSASNPIETQYSQSPVLSSTPPPTAFVGSHHTPNIGPLIPPLRQTTMTPPFAARTGGFELEPMALPPAATLEEAPPLDHLQHSPFAPKQVTSNFMISSTMVDSMMPPSLSKTGERDVLSSAHDFAEEMPFAVDDTEKDALSSTLVKTTRLKLLDSSSRLSTTTSDLAALSSQLDDFRTFGQSLLHDSEEAASASTPISLST